MKRFVWILGVTCLALIGYFAFFFHRKSPPTMAEFKKLPGSSYTMSAADFVISMAKEGGLPGFVKGEHGSVNAPQPVKAQVETFPISRTVEMQKANDPSLYHYTVVIAEQGAAWKLEKAWKSDLAGKVINEFDIPQ